MELQNFLRTKYGKTALAIILITGGIMTSHAIPGREAAAQGSAQAKMMPTVETAKIFIEGAEKKLLDLWIRGMRTEWVHETFITSDTETIAAQADEAIKAATANLAAEARQYESLKLPEEIARKIYILKHSVDIPAPRNAAEQTELATIAASLQSDYGTGKWCPDGPKGKCLSLDELENILATSRDADQLKGVWVGWHAIAPPMKDRYTRLVVLSNKGARELGFADTGAMWRAGYDMSPEDFSKELDRLWMQVRPLYVSLHAYARTQLVKQYGAGPIGTDGAIPAHLLGNMWSQTWDNIYPLLAPPNADPGYDVGEILKAKNIDAVEMVHYGERFFMSLGFPALPGTFWERSMFVKPHDREVVCHASAWDIDYVDDLRIKMCIEQKAEHFTTIHHELGHNFYQRAYDGQPPLYRDSANDGFHEAIGDTIALSVTPEYLKQIGLLETVPPASADIGLLMKRALDKVAFLPFGLLIDNWRWGVFSGKITPADYNKAWWELRREYQGIAPPVARSEADFDPGAKYHVAANVPYARYFLAAILQYQFHRALCRVAGYTGPLHRCSIYNNKEAGAKLAKMLAMGKSRPWPEALEALTGEKQMDATAILDYYAPLKQWLDEQNKKSGAKLDW
ncbi:MAG TPA: M2 family metallopeptidase [Candidatus Sulfotelmatobacter sp.]|nr:M2 family metallopeptidase [Candidatus Sulfotelmatobacter sp.]